MLYIYEKELEFPALYSKISLLECGQVMHRMG